MHNLYYPIVQEKLKGSTPKHTQHKHKLLAQRNQSNNEASGLNSIFIPSACKDDLLQILNYMCKYAQSCVVLYVVKSICCSNEVQLYLCIIDWCVVTYTNCWLIFIGSARRVLLQITLYARLYSLVVSEYPFGMQPAPPGWTRNHRLLCNNNGIENIYHI